MMEKAVLISIRPQWCELIASGNWSFVLATYATVCLRQPLPLETLSETAINVIIGTLLCKVLENALEHNDGGIWGISNGGTRAGASEDVPESDTKF